MFVWANASEETSDELRFIKLLFVSTYEIKLYTSISNFSPEPEFENNDFEHHVSI